MSISSMTGFARATGELQTGLHDVKWLFEIKSVNGKALDIKTKLPLEYEDLSFELKRIAGKYLQRGNVSVFLELQNCNENTQVKINDALLKQLTDKAIELYYNYENELEKPKSTDLLSMRGVVETVETPFSDADRAILCAHLMEDFEVLCRKLAVDRRNEGEKVQGALSAILEKISAIVQRLEDIANSQPEKIKKKLDEQIKQWLGDANINEDRLAQEVVLYVTRADVREEIDRLKAHIQTAAELLNSSEAVGRRLDFLCQELNREANTTCSKSSDVEQTALGMELKALIEQFREQIQNIE